MAAVDDVIEAVERVLDGVDDLDQRFGHAVSEADDALDKALGVGDQGTIDGFSSLKDTLEKLKEQLEGFRTQTEGVLSELGAIKGTT